MEKDVVRIFSVCKVSENGSGAYATLVKFYDKSGRVCEKYMTQGETFAGQTRLQLRGIVDGLEFAQELCETERDAESEEITCRIEVNTDSKFIIDTIRNNWLEKWVENDWKRGKLQPVQNVELWMRLVELMEFYSIVFRRIEADSQSEDVAKCDDLVEETFKNTIFIGKHIR